MARTRKPPEPDIAVEAMLDHLRTITKALDDVVEAASYGNPAFKVGGKPFAVIDRYKGVACLWLNVASDVRDDLLAKPGWFEAPYDPKKRSLCCALDQLDRRRVKGLVTASYKLTKGP